MPEATEIWQVDVNGTVYDAQFGELPEWIDGGSLLPGDKVRKGNLRWIEARRVPSLVPFFNAKETGEPMPFVVTVSEGEPVVAEPTAVAEPVIADPVVVPEPLSSAPAVAFDPTRCSLHDDRESSYFCDGCANGFCKECPTSFGSSVKICPLCGAMCKRAEEAKAINKLLQQESVAINEAFGLADFARALGHPLKFKVSLFFGAFLFMLLTVARSAAGMGGMYMAVGGIFAGMSANALTFGVLSHTLNNFIQGKLDENFMPDFDDFELWEDVIHPFFLSIAAYLSAFGPFFLTLAIGFYLVSSAVADQMDSYKSDLERIPGTHIYNGRQLVDQSGDVKEVLQGIDQRQRDRIHTATQVADGASDPDPNAGATPFVDEESRQQEELWAAATESRKQSLESALGKTPGTEAKEEADMFQAMMGLAAPLAVVGFITFLWGLFYFPAACAVAGYTRTFTSTINPLVGLDTIKRLGVDYVKLLGITAILMVASILVGGFFSMVFAPLALPGLGNIPATAFSAFFSFYLVAVFSCLLGYLLFKRVDKLGLQR
ncbi:MAG: hypothetical protein PSX80_08715 [bacterium]|nr:hypothetical protein [bacterium]